MKYTIYLLFLLLFTNLNAQNQEDMEILNKIIETYTHCATYYDEGTLTSKLLHKTNSMYNIDYEGDFKTVYEKNGRFKFEGNKNSRFQKNEIIIERLGENDIRVQQKYRDTNEPLQNISYLTAKYADSPILLFANELNPSFKHPLKNRGKLSRLSDAVYEGQSCYRFSLDIKTKLTSEQLNLIKTAQDSVKKMHPNSETVDMDLSGEIIAGDIYWFRKEDYLLLKHESYQSIGDGDIKTIYTYKPKVNILLTDEDFE